MGRRTSSRRTVPSQTTLLVVGFTVLLAAGTLWLLAKHTRGAEIANDIALPISILGVSIPVLGNRLRPTSTDHQALSAAARKLAHEVATREKAEQLKLLAEAGRGLPADVGFTQATVQVMWRTDGGTRHGSLTHIADFYASLGLKRLVVLGEPGSGKTVLIDQLLLDLIERLPEEDLPPGQRLLVPVRLSLPAFDPGPSALASNGESEARRLSSWLTSHLVDVFGLERAVAGALVAEGWILPVLDGLDEMDPEGQRPVRAAAAMRALNYPVGTRPRPAVVACRSNRYLQLATASTGPGRTQVLEDATAVELDPLSIEQVIAYLTRRFPDPNRPDRVQRRWRPVIDDLRSQPAGELAKVLRSPLRLFVAVTAYFNGDPRALLSVPGTDLDKHLFDRLIPSVTEQHPGPSGTDYRAADVTRWLTTLALHLRRRAEVGGSETDLELHLLWTAAGEKQPRHRAAGMLAAVAAATFVAPIAWSRHTFHSWRPYNGYAWILDGLAAALVALTLKRALAAKVNLRRLDLASLLTRAGRHHTFGWFLRSLTVGLLLGAVFGRAYGPAFGFFFGIAFGSAFGISFGLAQKPSITSRPSVLVAQGIEHDVMVIAAFTCSFGLANGFANGLLDGLMGGVTYGAAYGCAIGITVIARSPWPRYFVATRLLTKKKRLPARTAVFVDWACEAGLLRQSGIAVQFRHRELQARIIETAGLRGMIPLE
jgi:hypothetical protein